VSGRIGHTRWSVSAYVEPRDVWVGVFWDRDVDTYERTWLTVYVCLLPCLPVRFQRAPTSWYAHTDKVRRGEAEPMTEPF
jgi:hypothetical protein